MATFHGANPAAVYTQDDQTKGKFPVQGVYAETTDSSGRSCGWWSCLVAASQNLTQGQLVTIDNNFVVTVMAANAGTQSANASSANMLGVVQTSATASASACIWVQVFGVSSVKVASASTNPFIALKGSATAGEVDASQTSISAIIGGIELLVTSGAAHALTKCMLNFPRFSPMGDIA